MIDDIKNEILKYLKDTSGGIASRDLMRQMGISEKYSKNFYQAVTQLRHDDLVSVNRNHILSLRHQEEQQNIPATIVSLSRGFAFARPDDGGDDMFLRAEDLHDAFLGDHVELGNIKQSIKGPSCEVMKITEKAEPIVNGSIVQGEISAELNPDAAIRFHVPIEDFFHCGAKIGDKVQTVIRRLPHSSRFIAKVTKVYGRADCAKICADSILDQNSVRIPFPEEVKREALTMKNRKITPEELSGRSDFRDWPICTIDSASAKDLDDAVSCVKIPEGYRLGVHIADVSHYVREGTALDKEAALRATSVYLPDRVVPMLPEEISNGVCSLNAGTDKLTFSAVMDINPEGEIVHYEFHKSVIDSKVRGVYTEVNALFDGTADEALKEKYAPVRESLNCCRELADILRERAKRAGNFDLDTSESEFVLDENGICIDVMPRHSGTSERMIEQLMIAANQAAAKLAKAKKLPFVYRVHEQPDPDRIDTLAELVGALGLSAKSLKHTGDITTKDFAAIMEQAQGTPAEKIVSHQLLRTMAKARYDVSPVGHFGLALADYCHFTSPIRRYPDTSIHRILTAFLGGEDHDTIVKKYSDFAAASAKQSSRMEIKAMTSERDADDCYAAEYMKQHLGEEFDGIISGCTMRGIFVELPNTVEGFVPSISFEGKHFEFDGMVSQVDVTTREKLSIGDPIRVKAVAADISSGRVDFVPA